MDKRGWRVTESSYVVDTRFLRLRKDTIELPGGEVVNDYYVRESRGFIIVCALTPERRVVLVRQYKHGIGKELLELPAGAIDPGERPEQTALRELREETGYSAAAIEHVRTFVVDPTNSDTVAHLFLARDSTVTGAQDLDVTEDIRVSTARVSELRAMVRDGSIDSMPHVAAVYLLVDLGLI
ncbi:MAG: NUDIX hydrolase [Candidatus Baltobacteraceae bacterium]